MNKHTENKTLKYKYESELQKDVVCFLNMCKNLKYNTEGKELNFHILTNVLDHMAERNSLSRMLKIMSAKACGYTTSQSDLIICSPLGNLPIELKVSKAKTYTKGKLNARAQKQLEFIESLSKCDGFFLGFIHWDLWTILDKVCEIYKIPFFPYEPLYNIK